MMGNSSLFPFFLSSRDVILVAVIDRLTDAFLMSHHANSHDHHDLDDDGKRRRPAPIASTTMTASALEDVNHATLANFEHENQEFLDLIYRIMGYVPKTKHVPWPTTPTLDDCIARIRAATTYITSVSMRLNRARIPGEADLRMNDAHIGPLVVAARDLHLAALRLHPAENMHEILQTWPLTATVHIQHAHALLQEATRAKAATPARIIETKQPRKRGARRSQRSDTELLDHAATVERDVKEGRLPAGALAEVEEEIMARDAKGFTVALPPPLKFLTPANLVRRFRIDDDWWDADEFAGAIQQLEYTEERDVFMVELYYWATTGTFGDQTDTIVNAVRAVLDDEEYAPRGVKRAGDSAPADEQPQRPPKRRRRLPPPPSPPHPTITNTIRTTVQAPSITTIVCTMLIEKLVEWLAGRAFSLFG
jgi:hypothetical protein